MGSDAPETRYVEVDGTQVAYQVFGDRESSLDIVLLGGLGSHLDLSWDLPWYRVADGLASFARLIQFDRRGMGASGGSREVPPTWEQWTSDLEAVMDAAASELAALVAEVDSGPIAMLFAAAHPQRVRALVLANTTARALADTDYPIGVEGLDRIIEFVRARWGTIELAKAVVPSRADDPSFVSSYARLLRACAPPHTAAAQYRYIMERLDVREVLPLIQAPTLVLHHDRHPTFPVEHGRYIAHHIEGAKLIELPSKAMKLDDRAGEAVDAISEFLTGDRASVPIDRVLTTILFTDIVESTEAAAGLGDQRWRQLLDAHDRAVRVQLQRFRGREIKTTGDGFVAAFDGPGRAIQCARAIVDATGGLGLAVRAGLHTGECEMRGDDLSGLSVHIAARVTALAGPGEILVTSTVRDMVAGSGIEFTDRGLYELKGVPDERQVLAVARG